MDINYDMLPAHMQEGTKRYIEEGIQPGGFLTKVICNDLFGAYRRADDVNMSRMKDWVLFFYNEAPSNCYGSQESMNNWIRDIHIKKTA